MYPLQSLLNDGAKVVGGSDWIYGPLDPLESLEVMVTRQDPHDSNGRTGNTEESISLAAAIESYTQSAAWALHQESITGSIEVGKKADIVVLSENLFEIPATRISDINVTATIFDGRLVYQRPASNR